MVAPSCSCCDERLGSTSLGKGLPVGNAQPGNVKHELQELFDRRMFGKPVQPDCYRCRTSGHDGRAVEPSNCVIDRESPHCRWRHQLARRVRYLVLRTPCRPRDELLGMGDSLGRGAQSWSSRHKRLLESQTDYDSPSADPTADPALCDQQFSLLCTATLPAGWLRFLRVR